MRLVDEVARQQAVHLPPGGTAPYLLPLDRTLGGPRGRVHHGHLPHRLGLARFAARGAGGLHRHHVPSSLPPSTCLGDVVDVSQAASSLRRRGVVLLSGQLIAINLLVVGVLALLGAIELPTWDAMVSSSSASRGRRLHELVRSSRAPGAWRQRPAAADRGARPLGLAAAYAPSRHSSSAQPSGNRTGRYVFGPSLSGSSAAKALGTAPDPAEHGRGPRRHRLRVDGALLVRLARMWSRSSAARVRARDRRARILYLRSFDDDALPLAAVVTGPATIPRAVPPPRFRPVRGVLGLGAGTSWTRRRHRATRTVSVNARCRP